MIVSKTSAASGQLDTLFLASFEQVWSWGLIIFGFHLIVIGWLPIKGQDFPSWLGIVSVIAGIGYLIVHLTPLFYSTTNKIFTLVEMVFMAPMIVGDLGLAICLLTLRNANSFSNSTERFWFHSQITGDLMVRNSVTQVSPLI